MRQKREERLALERVLQMGKHHINIIVSLQRATKPRPKALLRRLAERFSDPSEVHKTLSLRKGKPLSQGLSEVTENSSENVYEMSSKSPHQAPGCSRLGLLPF
jgi:hypothetical protein